MNLNLFERKTVAPLSYFGLKGAFWQINIETIIDTWIALACLIIGTILLRILLSKKNEVAIQVTLFLGSIFDSFAKLIEDGVGYLDMEVFNFLIGIFFVTLAMNSTGVLPFSGEATTDLNTTIAVACFCFFFAQYQGLKHKGKKYFGKFFAPVFLLFPLNLLSQFLKIASFSFRLFGNMISGAILWGLFKNLIVSKLAVPAIVVFAASFLILALAKRFEPSSKEGWWGKVINLAIVFTTITPCVQILFGSVHGLIQAYILTFLTSMLISTERSESGGH